MAAGRILPFSAYVASRFAGLVELGEILNINKSTLLNMQELELQDGVKVIPANQIVLPTGIADMSQRIFAVYADVETFAKRK